MCLLYGSGRFKERQQLKEVNSVKVLVLPLKVSALLSEERAMHSMTLKGFKKQNRTNSNCCIANM